MNSVVPHSPHARSDYIGAATIIVRGTEVAAQIELKGYREPIDGIYRWIGRIAPNPELAALLGDEPRTTVTVRTAHSERDALAGDCDPWGRYRIMGKSTPPFPVPTEIE